MKDDVQKTIFGTLAFFIIGIVLWVSIVYLNACGFTFTCQKPAPIGVRTPIPTLIPATLPAPNFSAMQPASSTSTTGSNAQPATDVDIARPSNSGGTGEAVNLTGDANAGAQVFAANCVPCHGSEGKGGIPNPGSADGTVPALNPIDPTIQNSDFKTFAYNLDLFLEHGSTPEGPSPALKMPAWGDSKALTPQQIADVMAYLISLNPVPVASPEVDIAKPSNPGGPGDAVNLTGDANAGAQVFATNCVPCHGTAGKGGIPNPGSADGSVPALNPIDPTIANPDHKTFATNIDLFVEHGSSPEGTPALKMPAWGDSKALQPQQIADVIAYIISLNP